MPTNASRKNDSQGNWSSQCKWNETFHVLPLLVTEWEWRVWLEPGLKWCIRYCIWEFLYQWPQLIPRGSYFMKYTTKVFDKHCHLALTLIWFLNLGLTLCCCNVCTWSIAAAAWSVSGVSYLRWLPIKLRIKLRVFKSIRLLTFNAIYNRSNLFKFTKYLPFENSSMLHITGRLSWSLSPESHFNTN